MLRFTSSGRSSTRAIRRIVSIGVNTPPTIPCETAASKRSQKKGGDVALELDDSGSTSPDTSPESAHAMRVSSSDGS